MKCVVCNPIPIDLEQAKLRNPAIPVYGSSVYLCGVVQALLRYGTYDRYCVKSQRAGQEGSVQLDSRIFLYSNASPPQFQPDDDVILFAGAPAMFVMSPWRALLKKPDAPIVGTIHSMHEDTFGLVLWRLLLGGEFHEHDALICSTSAGKRVVENLLRAIGETAESRVAPRFRLPVIPLGLDTAEFQHSDEPGVRAGLGLPSDAFVFLYLGRFSATMKGDLAPLVLLFCRRIAPKFEKAVLVLAGDDTAAQLTPSLRALAGQLGCSDRVFVVPDITPAQKRELYSAADVFISPSDNTQETFGLTLVEAMSAGLPIIASDWDGYKELVDHGRTGFLAPTYFAPADESTEELRSAMALSTPASIAAETAVDMAAVGQYMETLITNPELRESMRREAAHKAQHRYDWKVVIRQYEELWDELLLHARSGASRPRATAPSLPSLGFKALFGHYATGFLNEHRLRLAVNDDASENHVLALAAKNAGRLEAKLFRALLAEVRDCGPLAASELCSRLAGRQNGLGHLTTDHVWAHIARLLKYGLLELT